MKKLFGIIGLIAALAIHTAIVHAQATGSGIQQSGSVTANHCAMWLGKLLQADSGAACVTYPSAGIPISNGSGWGASLTTTGTGTTLALNNSPTLFTPIFSGTATGSVTGNAGTATALAAVPSQCTSGQFSTGVAANGAANCSTPSGSGYVVGPGSSTSGFVPLWNNTAGTLLSSGLPVATTGINTIVETNGSGLIAAAIVPTLNQNTTGTAANITATSNSTLTTLPDLALPVGQITGLGAGVSTALAVNIGSAGAPVVNGGTLGTPSSGVATNLTGTASSLNIGGTAPAGSLIGATLASNVLNSSLTSIGTQAAAVTAPNFVANGTGANTLPSGITSQQPGSPVAGMVRYNSTWGGVETYVGGVWSAIWSPPGTYYCALYGALGMSSDDGASIQNCFNAARSYATNGGTAVLDSIAYAILTPPTVDPFKVTVNMGYGELNCSNLSSGGCVTVSQNAGNPNNQGALFQHEFYNGTILLPTTVSTTVDGFVFAGTSVAKPTALYNIHNIFVNEGRHADNYQSNAYLVTHRDFSYANQQSASVFSPTGFTNNDEALNYFGGVISQSASYALDSESTNGTNFLFVGTSFDFNAFIFNIASGYVNCLGCHAEMQGSALTGPIVVIGNATGATLDWVGGQLFMDGSGTPWSGAASIVSIGAAGSATFDHVFLHNLALTSGFFASGTGRLRVENMGQFTVPNGFTTLTDTGNTSTNLLADPTFAQSTIHDPIFITGDTQTSVDPHTGSNITLANSTSCSGAGPSGTDAQGLLITKSFGSGSVATAEILVPVDRMSMPLSSGYYEKTGAQTGTVAIQTNWVEVDYYINGIPHIANSLQNALTTITLTSSPTAWTFFGGPGQFNGYGPAWATHMQINLNFNSMNAGTFCIGHVVINEVK